MTQQWPVTDTSWLMLTSSCSNHHHCLYRLSGATTKVKSGHLHEIENLVEKFYHLRNTRMHRQSWQECMKPSRPSCSQKLLCACWAAPSHQIWPALTWANPVANKTNARSVHNITIIIRIMDFDNGTEYFSKLRNDQWGHQSTHIPQRSFRKWHKVI